MSKPKVDLYVGHGIKPDGTFDPGAVKGSKTEQTEGDKVVAAVAKHLEGLVDLAHEAYSDDPNFVGSVRASNKRGADVVVAVHHDWAGAPRGGFGFWYPGSRSGKNLADQILNAYKRRELPVRSPWHKARNLYVTRKTRATAVLWECGPIGAYTDTQLAQVAEAIAEGVLEHLGIEAPSRPTESKVQTDTQALKRIAEHLKIPYGTHINSGDRQRIVKEVIRRT